MGQPITTILPSHTEIHLLPKEQQWPPTGNWSWVVATGKLHWSEEQFRIFGLDSETAPPSFYGVLQLVHRDDRASLMKGLENAVRQGSNFEWNCRVLTSNDGIKHVHNTSRPIFDAFGKLTEFIGITIDVTECNRLAEDREDLLRRLAFAQEEEQRRIARELHDTAAQRLALIEMGLNSLAEQLPLSYEQAGHFLEQLKHNATELSNELRDLAHQLHPSNLEHLGLRVALRQLIDDFAVHWEKPIDLVVSVIPDEISLDAAAAIYRITQEALRNISKHAAGAFILVVLKSSNTHLLLRIEDDGPGFAYKKGAKL